MNWYWIFAAPAILLAILSLFGERKRADYVSMRLAQKPTRFPRVAVIVPVKGEDEGLRENLAALAALDYPNYHLIITARSAADIPPGVLPKRASIVLAGGDDPNTGEKVQNLKTAVKSAGQAAEIYAFADSDGCVTPGWLQALVAPLEDENVGASTGYRWFMPEPPTFWSLMRGVWDAVALGQLGPGNSGFAWGGAMAIRKETFFAIRMLDAWTHTISDDYALSAAVRKAGLTIAYAPGAMVPTRERLPMVKFFAWARRQMMITRFYNQRLWRRGVIAHIIYCTGMAASIAASIQGYRLAEWALLAQLSPGMLKGLNRAILAKATMPEHEAWFKRHSWVHAIWTPLATWVWLAVLGASAFGDTIRWRGYEYRLKRPSAAAGEPR